MESSFEISPKVIARAKKEKFESGGEVPAITRKDHECSICEQNIPTDSKVYMSKRRTDFEFLEKGAKKLDKPVYKNLYRHYPDCEDPQVASPIPEKVDLPSEDEFIN